MQQASPIHAFRRDAEVALPDAVVRMMLFGSRARGDARSDSDWDLAVFVRDDVNIRAAQTALSDVAYEYVVRGHDIRPIAFEAHRWDDDSEIVHRIRREGVEILPA